MKHVPRTAPDGLIGWTINRKLLERAAMVYEMEWDWDNGIEALITDRRRKIKVVKVTCSECGESMYMNYAPASAAGYGRDATYGFFTGYEYSCGGTVVTSGDEVECPMCGARCVAKKAAEIGRGRFVSDEAHVTSAQLADYPDGDGRRPLALICWRIRREADRYGYDRYLAEPLDAYVFDETEAKKLTGSVTAYSGSAGYYLAIKSDWGMPKRWTCDWDYSTEIYGLTPELVARSSVERSRLDEYMQQSPIRGERRKYPIIYLRLWQKHPQAENLVHQGASHILDALIEEHTDRESWRENKEGRLELPELDWSASRPSQILRLDREEWRAMQAQCWDAWHWKIYVTAKQVGDRMRIPEDIVNLHRYGGEDIDRIIGLAPVGKCLRYLLRQYEKTGESWETDETDPEGMIRDDRIFGAAELADYWRMAKACGWDLANPAVRWPRSLEAAHERARETYRLVAEKRKKQEFRKTYKALQRLEYASGDFLIRPARTLQELKDEGAALNHCVGSYGEQHLSGKPIFFLRRAEEPDRPFFTLQLDTEKQAVIQNRGRNNCARTPEVEAFEAQWIRWVRKGAKRKKDGTPVGAKPKAQPKTNTEDKKETEA